MKHMCRWTPLDPLSEQVNAWTPSDGNRPTRLFSDAGRPFLPSSAAMEYFDSTVDEFVTLVKTYCPPASDYVEWWMTQYRTNPMHVFMETVLFVFILYVFFKRPSALKVGQGLSEKEVEELLTEWEPEPLVPQVEAGAVEAEEKLIINGKAGARVNVEGRGEMVDMASFDFLGFSTDEDIKEECVKVLKHYGCGSCGPRGFYGTVDLHLELEKSLAEFFSVQESIMYSDAESTVASVVPAFAKRGDLVVMDEYCNDNLLTGVMLCRSKVYVYRHNDMADLERVLDLIHNNDIKTGSSPSVQRRFIITEGLFRNTGQILDLPALHRLKLKHGCRLICDESLSFGVLGKTGRGVSEHYDMDITAIDIMSSSLSAALGSVGGFCIGNEREVVDHQRLSGAGYCFSASTPPFVAKAATLALQKMQDSNASAQMLTQSLQHRLRVNVDEILTGIESIPDLVVVSDEASPIIHVALSEDAKEDLNDDETNVLATIASYVRDHGHVFIVHSKYISSAPNLRVVGEKSATFQPGHPRPTIRIVASALHTADDIDRLVLYLTRAVERAW